MDLKKYLMDAPAIYDYSHQEVQRMRQNLRSELFRHATSDFKYLPYIFDGDTQKDRIERMESRISPSTWVTQPVKKCSHGHPGRPCVLKLSRGEPTHRCLTCGIDDTCVLCKYCFNPADHEGHNVFVKVSNRDEGGICDCGDDEAWKRPLKCLASQHEKVDYQELPQEFIDSLNSTLAIALNYCIDVLSSAHPGIQFYNRPDQFIEAAKDSELDEAIYGSKNPPGNGKYVLNMWHDDKRSFSDCQSSVELATQRPAEFSRMIGKVLEKTGRATISISDNLPQLLEQKARLKLFSCTIRTTRDHFREEMVDEIIHWVFDLTQCHPRNVLPTAILYLVGQAMLDSWDVGCLNRSNGADIPFSQPAWSHSLLKDGTMIPSVDDRHNLNPEYITSPLSVGISGVSASSNPSRRLQSPVAAPIGPIAGPGAAAGAAGAATAAAIAMPTISATPPPGNGDDELFDFDQGIRFTDLVAAQNVLYHTQGPGLASEAIPQTSPLWDNCQYRPPEANAARVKYLIFFDIRMWKSLRSVLNDLNVSALITVPEFKRRLGEIQASIYPLVAELYVLIDREPEVSVITMLSTQLFTTPSIATSVMRGEAFTRYLALLYTLFTTQRVGPPSSISPGKVVLSTPMFRNRRLAQLFHELEHLMNRNTEKDLIAGNPLHIMQTADLLSLFQSLAPLRRQVDKHVEYESESWVYFFTTIPLVLQFAHAVSQAAIHSPHDKVVDGIGLVAATLQKWAYVVLARLSDAETIRLRHFVAEYAGNQVSRSLSGLSVADDLMSLHHPVHAFLSWLVEYARFSTIDELRKIIFNNNLTLSRDLGISEQLMASLLFDNTLRTMAFLSEIHVGLWVRNGYTVRSQLHHYRESTLRDLAYARDVFFAQMGLVCLDPNTAFLQLLHRWNMADWPDDPLFDDSQRWYMLEEFLHTLTFLLTDRVHLQGWSDQEVKRHCLEREIVQCLAFGPMSYSVLVKHVPDTMATDEEFDMALADCAEFRPPRGLRDVGVYTLKPELLKNFDAHFTYFNATRIEEAEKAIVERRAAHEGSSSDFVHVPPLLNLAGPWAQLGAYTRSVSFARFMHDLLERLLDSREQPQAESLLGKALHLLTMAALDDLQREPIQNEDPGVFNSLPLMIMAQSDPTDPESKSIGHYLQLISTEKSLCYLHNRAFYLFDILQRIDSRIGSLFASGTPGDDSVMMSSSASLQTTTDSSSITTELERKKQLAKAAQDRVLNEFKEQQEKFALQNQEANSDDEMKVVTDIAPDSYVFPKDQCVMCRMPDDEGSIYGLMTYTCNVRVARDVPYEGYELWKKEGYKGPLGSMDVEHPQEDLETDDMYGPAFPVRYSNFTPSIQGCGHGIHYQCFKEFQLAQKSRALATPRPPLERIAAGEFLCPLCKGLNNCFMPVLWSQNSLSADKYLQPPADDLRDIQNFLEIRRPSGSAKENLEGLVKVGLDGLNERFEQAIIQQDFAETIPAEVRSVLLSQMLRVKDVATSIDFDGSMASKTRDLFGLRHIFTAVSGTITALEISLRGQKHASQFGGVVMDQLPSKSSQFLRVFVKYVTTLTGFVVSGCLRLNWNSLEFNYRNPFDSDPDDYFDPFAKLVECLFFAAPTYNIAPITVIRAIYATYLVRILAYYDIGDYVPQSDNVPPEILKSISHWSYSDPRRMYSAVLRHATLFLRKASLLVYGICGKYDADDFACMMSQTECDRLSLYLGLPSLNDAILSLRGQTPLGFAANHIMDRNLCFSAVEYPGIYRLLRLPVRLDAFFNIPSVKVPVDPAVCLFCGAIVPTQGSEGDARIGSCNQHLQVCTGHYGLFLLPRRSVVLLLLGDGRGMFTPAPYLDAHGEPDEGMRRERPHYLQKIRYDAFVRQMWLENGIYSFTLRKLDQYSDIGGWETL